MPGPWRRTSSTRTLQAERPDEKWGADISYVWTREGWLYLAVVIDLFARRVVGWAVGDRLHRNLASGSALRKALLTRRPAAGLIHHSDRGSQYCSIDYQAELRRARHPDLMSGKGNCYDNAMVEAFFKTLKSEYLFGARSSKPAPRPSWPSPATSMASTIRCDATRRSTSSAPMQFEGQATDQPKRLSTKRGKSTPPRCWFRAIEAT